jgi:segregation and condensation protein A
MVYVEMMKELQLELAAEYLVMAAMLAEIKSRMLLPRPSEDTEEEDPRAELIRRLQEYERFKKAAEGIDALPQVNREIFIAEAEAPESRIVKVVPKVDLPEIMLAFQEVISRASMYTHHHVLLEPLSVRERMTNILSTLSVDKFVGFAALFTPEEGRRGVVVSLLAILELVKESLIELIQTETYGPIYVKVPHHVNESSEA